MPKLSIFHINIIIIITNYILREDTHKKNCFFSGRTTKCVGLTTLTTKQKNTFFPKSGMGHHAIGEGRVKP